MVMRYDVEQFGIEVFNREFTEMNTELDYLNNLEEMLAKLAGNWLNYTGDSFYDVIMSLADDSIARSTHDLYLDLQYVSDVFESVVSENGGLINGNLLNTIIFTQNRVLREVLQDNYEMIVADYIVEECLAKYVFEVSDEFVDRCVALNMDGEVEKQIQVEFDDFNNGMFRLVCNLTQEDGVNLMLSSVDEAVDEFIKGIGERLGIEVVKIGGYIKEKEFGR